MIKPTQSEYFTLAQDAYQLTTASGSVNTGFVVPLGFTEVDIDTTDLSDGFAAIALRDNHGNVIIVNEGTVPGTTGFNLGTGKADLSILQGNTPQALLDAAAF